MKKIAQLLVLAMISVTTFANDFNDNVSKSIQTSFTKKFSGAKEINWSSTDDYTKANFLMDGQHIVAYFTKTGELIGTARNLVSQQLPLYLQAELKSSLNDGWITDLFEFNTEDDTSYYVTIETGDQKTVFKSINNHSWSVIKKSKKD